MDNATQEGYFENSCIEHLSISFCGPSSTLVDEESNSKQVFSCYSKCLQDFTVLLEAPPPIQNTPMKFDQCAVLWFQAVCNCAVVLGSVMQVLWAGCTQSVYNYPWKQRVSVSALYLLIFFPAQVAIYFFSLWSALINVLAKMLDMSEFGEAAPFLRKSEKEIMMMQTVAFDGKALSSGCVVNQLA